MFFLIVIAIAVYFIFFRDGKNDKSYGKTSYIPTNQEMDYYITKAGDEYGDILIIRVDTTGGNRDDLLVKVTDARQINNLLLTRRKFPLERIVIPKGSLSLEKDDNMTVIGISLSKKSKHYRTDSIWILDPEAILGRENKN